MVNWPVTVVHVAVSDSETPPLPATLTCDNDHDCQRSRSRSTFNVSPHLIILLHCACSLSVNAVTVDLFVNQVSVKLRLIDMYCTCPNYTLDILTAYPGDRRCVNFVRRFG